MSTTTQKSVSATRFAFVFSSPGANKQSNWRVENHDGEYGKREACAFRRRAKSNAADFVRLVHKIEATIPS